MEMAFTIAGWSSCFRAGRSIGCVIVKDKRIMTTGYNGAPAGIKTCKEKGECLRDRLGIPSGTRMETCYAVHAEQNAIVQAAKLGVSIEGATLYCTHQPCSMCCKMIINSGIKRVVYKEGYPDEFTLELFAEAKVQVEMLYPAFGDKTWMKSDFRLKNLTGSTISGMRLRYYYSGEGIDVSAQSFNPQASVSFGTDGGDVYYVEYTLTESVAGGAYANWGYGPQIGIHRNDKYNSFPAWNYNDDPSFDSSAIGGSFQVTDRIALLDEFRLRH